MSSFFTLKIRVKEFCCFFAQGVEQHKPIQSAYKPHCPMRLYQTLYAQLSILSAIMSIVYFYPVISLAIKSSISPATPPPISLFFFVSYRAVKHC